MIQSIEKGRKEDGNRSIADKIIKRLHDLDKTVENNQGRWAWELLQNAKDSVADDNRSVAVQIQLDEENVAFRHNGTHFTEQDIRGLINQISSKEIEEGQQTKKTGRFGTGFLTTHLLSKVIEINGVVETEDRDLFSFSFPLDRDGKTTGQLMPKIENAWTRFHGSATKLNGNYNSNNYNTTFSYSLKSEEQKNIARIGVEEFVRLIPFVLAFIPKISKVEIINNVSGQRIAFENSRQVVDDLIITIEKTENDSTTDIYIIYSCNETVAIAAEAIKTKGGYSIKSNKGMPKLFCDFPLIGTENFHFPVLVNSFYFNPQTERDGIWLKGKKDSEDKEVDENQKILTEAVELFKELLNKLAVGNFSELFNVAETKLPNTNEKYFDDAWYKDNIQKPMREVIYTAAIVEQNEAEERKRISDLWFPAKSYSDEVQEKLWQFTYDLYPGAVCKKEHITKWCNVSWEAWNKLNYNELVADLVKITSIRKLAEELNLDETKTFAWYNSLCKFILKDESNLSLFENNPITPDQNGNFKKRKEVYIDDIQDRTLVRVLQLLGTDWKNILLHDSVGFGEYYKKEKKDIATAISEKIKSNTDNNENFIQAVTLLSQWFEENDPEQSKILFSELYRKKAELFMNTISDKESLYKVMRSGINLSELSKIAQTLASNPALADNITGASELSKIFEEFNVTTIDELKNILRKNTGSSDNFPKIEFTPEVLAGLGISTLEELEAALRDKDWAALFKHSSTPNAAMFVYAQNLIARAKKNVIDHLKTNPAYDCSGMEELANSVIGGIKKDGLLIHLVIRPSDNGTVILYYTSEKDTLDYENAELWIENGKEKPRMLSLGKILKNTGINKIPV